MKEREYSINEEVHIMKLKIDTLEEKIDHVNAKLGVITEHLLNPDQGFVSRVNRNTQFREDIGPLVKDMYDIRRWKSTVSKVLWIITGGVLLGLVKVVFFLKS
jgi:hypothetical protein|tara:strand:+ start:296 stop:604 length:309 start_codon:yes stop_codon:yes gene_type:complete